MAWQPPSGPGHPHTRFVDHTQWRTTVGRTPLYKWSARHRVLYLTTHITLTTVLHPCPGGIRNHNLRRPAAADLRLTPRGHWDRHKDIQILIFFVIAIPIMGPLDVTTGWTTVKWPDGIFFYFERDDIHEWFIHLINTDTHFNTITEPEPTSPLVCDKASSDR